MIQLGTILKITDKTGVSAAMCIKVLGSGKKSIALLGDIILISVRGINLLRFSKLRDRQKRKFSKGTIHRALIIRTRAFYSRSTGIFIRFGENSAVLVNKAVVPLSNRIYGPILRNICFQFPSIGCVSRFLI